MWKFPPVTLRATSFLIEGRYPKFSNLISYRMVIYFKGLFNRNTMKKWNTMEKMEYIGPGQVRSCTTFQVAMHNLETIDENETFSVF